MRNILAMLVAGTLVSGIAAFAASGQTPAKVKLWRLDCGTVAANDLDAFSDTHAYAGQHRVLTDSCYLIKHGDTYMLWDTGLPAALKGKPIDPKEPMSASVTATIAAQLAKLGVKPSQIAVVGISHYHFDHIGQARDFPDAVLMIGKGDYDALSAKPPRNRADPAPLNHWIGGAGKTDPVTGDKDVFGDGSVTMLDMPGHTVGHHAVLVRLAETGPVLLSGDTAHFRENLDSDGVPTFNTDRADSLASMDRLKRLAINEHAIVVIQHDPRDIAKLPAFPQAAD